MTALSATLAKMDAPEELLVWSREFDDNWPEAWSQCPSPVWQFWLAGAGGRALNEVLEVAISWVAAAATSVPEAQELVRETLDKLTESASGEECAAMADRAESASRSAPASFRAKPPLGFEALAMAIAWVGRAAEGVFASRKRAEAVRMQRAQHVASLLGTGVDTTVVRAPPLCLDTDSLPDSPVHAELLYVVAALAQSAHYVLSTREAKQPDAPRTTLEEDEARLLRQIFKAF